MSKHIKTLPQKREGYRHTLIMALDVATTIEEFQSICKEGGMSNATAEHYLKEFNLKDLKDKKWKDWMYNRYWTTINCSYCDIEFDILKSRLQWKKYNHCSKECHMKNRANIADNIVSEKYEQMGLNWDEVKDCILEDYKLYRRNLTSWTKYNLRKHRPDLYEIWLNDNNIEIDHKWACVHGFRRGINPEIMSHIDNLQLLTKSENISKSGKWIDEIIPDVLREYTKLPIDLKRMDRLKPPPRFVQEPDSVCKHCNSDYFEHRSKADTAEDYCGITCERKEWLTPDREKMLYDLLKERILSLDWETPVDITKPIGDMYGSYMIGGRDIILKIFHSIWVDEYNLPIMNIRGSIERKLIECNEDYSFPKSYRGPFKLKCKDCGKVTITKYRITLMRFHNLVPRKDNETTYKDNCKTCSLKKSNTGVSRGGWTARNEKIKKEYGDKLSQWM
jgi:hypothetical protein|tara:strand:+ start:45 stop:1388 length:1344 start_codon:yes stop_codon:yes gene_type:complete